MTEESLFHDALAKPPAERAAFLDQACADQPALRAAIEALLAAHEASGNVLDQPAAAQAPPAADDLPRSPCECVGVVGPSLAFWTMSVSSSSGRAGSSFPTANRHEQL
jgi:hypothetical protein